MQTNRSNICFNVSLILRKTVQRNKGPYLLAYELVLCTQNLLTSSDFSL
jgi:hypothetical protein